MKIRLLSLPIFLLAFVTAVQGQYETVVYDYAKNWFGENQPLPAEQLWMLNGSLPEGIDRVELQIFKPGNRQDQLLHSTDFQKPDGSTFTQFHIPINFKLRGSSTYNLKVLYFKPATDDDIVRLSSQVSEALTAYLNQSVVAGRRSVTLAKHPRLMKQELDQIVVDGLSLYRNRMGVHFEGFSDIVYEKLYRIDDLKLSEARFNIRKQDDSNQQTRVAYFQQNVEDLARMLEQEVNHHLSGNFYVLHEARTITNYKSESVRWTLPINAGYAVIHDNVTDDGFSVEGSPMLGISFPLGNPNFTGSFWSNSSLSFGALLTPPTFDGDRDYEGPFTKPPLYLAYGYKTAYFLRINVGTAIMQEVGTNNLHLSPFVGLSVEFNLWLGLSK